MQMRTFWVLNAALVLGCGGNDYSDYFVPTGADRGTSSNGNGGASASTSVGTGGRSTTNGTGGSSGSGSGSSGTGNGSTGTGGPGGSSGSGGSGSTVDAGGSGCRGASAWMMGQPYTAGASVRGVCMNQGGGASMCEMGKTYLWTCKEGAACSVYGPGADGWWGAWTVGMRCD
jgi:hypothetical protein